MFYSAFYLMCQIGFLIGYGTELIAIQIIEPMRPWVIMLPIPATIATILAIVGRLSTIKLFVVALCLRPRFWFIQPVPCRGPVINVRARDCLSLCSIRSMESVFVNLVASKLFFDFEGHTVVFNSTPQL